MSSSDWILVVIAVALLIATIGLYFADSLGWLVTGPMIGICLLLVFTSGQDTTQPKDTHSYTTAGALAELQGRKFEVDVTSIKPVPDSKDTWTVDVTKYEGDPCKATVEVEGSYGQYLIFFGGCEA